jgi:hypothetical protein
MAARLSTPAQKWVTPEKLVTPNSCGPLVTYTEVDKMNGCVKITTYAKSK